MLTALKKNAWSSLQGSAGIKQIGGGEATEISMSSTTGRSGGELPFLARKVPLVSLAGTLIVTDVVGAACCHRWTLVAIPVFGGLTKEEGNDFCVGSTMVDFFASTATESPVVSTIARSLPFVRPVSAVRGDALSVLALFRTDFTALRDGRRSTGIPLRRLQVPTFSCQSIFWRSKVWVRHCGSCMRRGHCKRRTNDGRAEEKVLYRKVLKDQLTAEIGPEGNLKGGQSEARSGAPNTGRPHVIPLQTRKLDITT
ncbi:hypothetical protein MKZ38_003215 [Zalerion maritima]|uniref:Uncharacterized protein n=1 Tax=Zalerion maritima TaxID=339359 RepID=A0AAD5S0K7_9PEZI|nr:hypothetical protein MKZ38_003215 [Zalerion maritima]